MAELSHILLTLLFAFWFFISFAYFVASLTSFRPTRSALFFVLSFFVSWLTIELAGFHILLILVGGTLAFLLGAANTTLGLIALVLNGVTIIALFLHIIKGQAAGLVMQDTLKDYVETPIQNDIPFSRLLFPFSFKRKGTHRQKNIEYARLQGRSLKMDVIAPTTPPQPGQKRPALIQIHGGAWVLGDKREQGLPLLYHMAAHGWVGFNVNYRLSPWATFPDHLIDVKRALAYIRRHADEYGIDPNFIAVTGGSAGGHLCALMELTANDPKYQPGFEDADTSVQAAVPFYGVYDFTDSLRLMGKDFLTKFLEPTVMKSFLDEEPEKFRDASPLHLLHANTPPTLIVHGDRDVLAPVDYARALYKELSAVSQQPVLYAEIPGAQHAFEIFMSPRTARVVSAVRYFLDTAHAKHISTSRYNSPFATPIIQDDSSLPVA